MRAGSASLWAWLAVACAPSAAAPPPAEPTAAAPVEIVPLREALPEAGRYQPMETVAVSGWLAAADQGTAWLRQAARCDAVGLDHGPSRVTGTVALCARRVGRVRVACRQELRVDTQLRAEDLICDVMSRDGSGIGKRDADAAAAPTLHLFEMTAELARYTTAWKLSVIAVGEASVQQQCAPGTAERARSRFRAHHPAAPPAQVDAAVAQTHGIIGDRRSCRTATAMQLVATRVGDKPPSSPALAERSDANPVDCSQPCPPDPILTGVDAYNDELRGRVMHDPRDPVVELFRQHTACEKAQPGASWIALPRSACRSAVRRKP